MPRRNIGKPKGMRTSVPSRFHVAGFPVLKALDDAGKIVSAWVLPGNDPTRYLTLDHLASRVLIWEAGFGTAKALMVPGTVDVGPFWDGTVYGNKGGVVFDGSAAMFLNSEGVLWPNRDTDVKMLAAVSQDAVPADTTQRVAFAYGQSNIAQRAVYRSVVTGVNRAVTTSGSGGVTVTGTANFTSAHTIGSVFDVAGNATTLYVDGASDGVGATNALAWTLNRARIGAPISGTGNWNGYISAVALLGPTATLQDFLDLEAEFRARIV